MQNDFLFLTIICLIIILVMIIWRIKKQNLIKPKYDERKNYLKAISKIKNICAFKGYKLIEDINIEANGKVSKIDGVIIGKSKIAVLNIKGYDGDIYTNPNGKTWVWVKGDKRKKFDNMLNISKQHVELVRRILAKSKVYGVEILNLIVFFGSSQIYAPSEFPICSKKNLKTKLKEIFKSQKTFIDTKRVEEVLKNPQKL